MTPEQLDEIEKLAEAQEFLRAGTYALPLVKALREAWVEAKRLSEIVAVYDDRFAAMYDEKNKERDEARAEVERLRSLLALKGWMEGKP